MVDIPEHYESLINSAGAATLSVLAKDGSIQSSLVWLDYDDGYIKLNMLAGSPKERNISREKKATVLVSNKEDEDSYISIRCILARVTSENAIEHLNHLTHRNMGLDNWYGDVEPKDCETKSRCIVVYLEPVRVYHT